MNPDDALVPSFAPDELLVVPVEDFLNRIQETFKNTPFIAINIARSFVANVEDEQGNTIPDALCGVVAIGFSMEQASEISDIMANMTNCESQIISTDDKDIAAMLKQALADDPLATILEDNTEELVIGIVDQAEGLTVIADTTPMDDDDTTGALEF